MLDIFRRFVASEAGGAAIEYGLIGMLIGLLGIAAFTVLGGGLANLFGTTSTGVGGQLEAATEIADG